MGLLEQEKASKKHKGKPEMPISYWSASVQTRLIPGIILRVIKMLSKYPEDNYLTA